jgi:hypothetical protein
MAKQEIEFEVTLEKLTFKFKGSHEVGQRLQTGLTRTLGNLIDTQRQAMALPAEPVNGQRTLFDMPSDEPVNGTPTQTAEPMPEKRKPRKTNGVSLIGLLRDLKNKERFFIEPRTVEAIRDRLKTMGHSYTESNIAARLLDLIKKNELFRSQSGEVYVYKDSKFDEVPRTEDTAPESAG